MSSFTAPASHSHLVCMCVRAIVCRPCLVQWRCYHPILAPPPRTSHASFTARPACVYRPDRLDLYAAESTHKSSCALYRRWALFAKELEALYDTFTKAGKAYTAKPQGAQPTEVQRCDHPPSGRGGAHGYLVGVELGSGILCALVKLME